jgi:selenocysteine-specific translation elongation factor
LQGIVCGVFGTNKNQKEIFEESIAKKSEVEGIIVYHRNESGLRYSFLDDVQYPERIQGYARIASISDYCYYLYPSSGKLAVSDGELAVLLDAFQIDGSIEAIDSEISQETIKSSFKGLRLSNFNIDHRNGRTSVIGLPKSDCSQNHPREGTMIYIDRAFNVKGVGVVVLGFILSGKVSVHDKLRLIPTSGEAKFADVKGIQISDVDYESAERGIRVGLSLKGVDAKELSKTSWLDDGSFPVSKKIKMNFNQSTFYKQTVVDRELSLQLPGELIVSKISKGENQNELVASLPFDVPIWERMRICILDLNAKNLRVTGSGLVSI